VFEKDNRDPHAAKGGKKIKKRRETVPTAEKKSMVSGTPPDMKERKGKKHVPGSRKKNGGKSKQKIKRHNSSCNPGTHLETWGKGGV